MAQTSFKGYAVHDSKNFTDFKVIEFESKRFEEYDVEIKITYCGVCGSDVHTITEGWGEMIKPMITGHEIVGKVTAVGPKVTEFKVGDRAGVGAQAWSCMKCNRCKNDNENYCTQQVDTYNAKYPHTGDIAHGGYSTGIRVHQQFVFAIPEKIEDKYAAPMLCGGLTVYSPLVRHGAGPGKKVGIIGMGGLGHFAVMFAAKGMDCDVTVFSSSEQKRADAMEMGAKKYIDYTKGGDDWIKEAGEDYDLIVSTRDVGEGFPIGDFLSLLNVHAKLVQVGLPDNPFPQIAAFAFAPSGCFFGGSHIGSKKECNAMLAMCAEKGIKTYVEELSMKDAGKAVMGVKENKVRYRYVLKQDIDP